MRKPKPGDRAALGRVIAHLRPQWGRIAASMFLAALASLLSLYLPVLAGRAIDAMMGTVDFAALSPLLRRILLLSLGASLTGYAQALLGNRVSFSAVRELRQRAFAHLQRLPIATLDARPSGDTLSRLIADADALADGLLLGVAQLATGVVSIVGTLVFMIRLSPAIALVVALLTPLSLAVAGFIARRTYAMTRRMAASRGAQTAMVEEILGGQRVVAAFGRQARVLEDFDVLSERLRADSLRAVFFSSLTNPATRAVNALVYAAVALLGALYAGRGTLTVGALAAFLSYASQYTKPFNEISSVLSELQSATACAARLFELIDLPAMPPDPEGAALPDPLAGAIEFQNVSFSYLPERPLIEDFSLRVTPGQHVAIVGPTGSGKTTLINLLMRFYEVDSGTITLDGVSTRAIPRAALRRSIGMVLQETWLSSGTIRENIALGKPDATPQQIEEAARAAHAHGFISRMPQGYDTRLSESGAQLSQGERQLLCIARLMLSLPPMLILDEATSSIDTRTEMQIQRAFAAMTKGRTSFIVAHRLSTIRSADVILVLKDGRVVEQGNHETLLAQGGVYASLYHTPFAP